MKPKQATWLLLAAIMAAGCGGTGTRFTGTVSGVVFDVNGDPVRDARVYVDTSHTDRETRSNSAGAYVLEGVPEGDQIIRAEVTQGGLRYYGQNVAQVFGSERSKSVNITVVRDTQHARITGTVSDRSGRRIEGAKVFALGNGNSSTYAITDEQGRYSLSALQSGLDYIVTASARFFINDEDVFNLATNESRTVNWVLSDATSPTLPAPQNLEAVVWTSPREVTRSDRVLGAIEAVKRLYDPRVAKVKQVGRLTSGGNWIETDLFWDFVDSLQLLGYGIYRGTNNFGPLTAIDFLRDPNANFFADNDEDLFEGVTYFYEVTSLNTLFPDTGNSQSGPSNRVSVTPLGDLELLNVLQNPLRFRWLEANGADEYVVFVFDTYPRIGITSIWNNAGTPTTNTQINYGGPSLISGRTYYYLVLGIGDGGDSRTISTVGQFVAN